MRTANVSVLYRYVGGVMQELLALGLVEVLKVRDECETCHWTDRKLLRTLVATPVCVTMTDHVHLYIWQTFQTSRLLACSM